MAEPIEITSGGLRLEGRIHAGGDDFGAIVLHPHPQYGGDMDNHVVVACCEALASLGGTALRFNFRGTGRSEGSYDEGRGERDDAVAALALMRERQPDGRVMLVGYSFGAMVAASAADADLAGLVLISPPVGMALLAQFPVAVPVLVATGDNDQVSPAAKVRALESSGVQVKVIAGVDHGWWPGIGELAATLERFVRTLTSPTP